MRQSESLRILLGIFHVSMQETIYQLFSSRKTPIRIQAAKDEEEFLRLAGNAPDIILLDPFGFHTSGLELIRRLRHDLPGSVLVALLRVDSVDYHDAAMRAGANATVAQETVNRLLIPTLMEVSRGKKFETHLREILLLHRNIFHIPGKEVNRMTNKTKLPNPVLSRRDFLKASTLALGGAAVVAAGPGGGQRVLRALEEGAPNSALSGQSAVFNTVCAPNCWMGCRIEAYVRDGKLVKTRFSPMPEERYNRICLRGMSHVQRVYDPDRFKYPMKRAGKRGENKWERISWEEAIKTIASEFNRVKEKYGSNAVAFAPMSGNYGIINGGLAGAIQRFAAIFQGTVAGGAIDSAMPLGLAQIIANHLNGGGAFGIGNEAADMAHSRLIIVWGSNITESQVHNWHFVADAIEENGAKLVVVDPTFTPTAAKAHLWIRPRPGSDPALTMSIIYTLIEEKLYDEEFVIQNSVAPFLVRGDDGMFLRENNDPAGKYMVWDSSTKQAVSFDTAVSPALEGSYKVDGLKVTPSFQLLVEEVAKYKPEDAISITDVPAEQVRELARLYAGRKPAFIYPGFGIDRYTNGHLTGRGLATMAALTGNLGISGATPAGAMGGGALMAALNPANLMGWLFPTGTFYNSMNYLLFYDAVTKGEVDMYVPKDMANPLAGASTAQPVKVPFPIKAAFLNTSNFISNFPNQNKVEQEVFSEDNLEFVVVADIRPTDTTAYADIILPVTHWFENDDIVGGIHPFLMRSEKALEAPFECKPDLEIFKLLAEEMGWGEYWQKSAKEYADEIVSEMAKNLGAKEAVEIYRKDGAVRIFPYPYYSFADKKFYTDSGRIEFYAEREIVNFPGTSPALGIPVSMGGKPMVHFEPPYEAWYENPLFEKYPLTNYQEHSRWRVHSQWFQVPWLREIDPEPVVKMNPEDANVRGLQSGDYAEVFNDRGKAVFKVILSEGIRKGMVNTPKGWQRYQFKKGGYQELTMDHKHPINLNCSFFDTLVEVKKA